MLRSFLLVLALIIFVETRSLAGILVGYPPVSNPTAPPGVYLGMFVNLHGSSGTRATKEADLEGIESSIGHALAFQLSFYNEYSLTASALSADPMIQGDITYHRVPYIAWNCRESLDDFINMSLPANAKTKSTVDQAAQAIKQLGVPQLGFPVPVYIRWFHEFNLCTNNPSTGCANGDYKGCFTAGYSAAQEAAQYIAAFEAVRSEFLALGVTNVTWVFCPAMGAANPFTTSQMQAFIPSNIDWNGFDDYDPSALNGLVATVTSAYNTFSSQGKPIFWTETAEDNSSCVSSVWTQQKYFQDLIANAQTSFPLIHGFGYFDAWPTNPNCARDWILDANGNSQFITLANTSYFTARAY